MPENSFLPTTKGPSLLDLILGGAAGKGMPPGWPYVMNAKTPAAPTAGAGAPDPLDQILNGSKQQATPKRRPLDYLVMAASPVVAGLTQAMLARRRQKGKAFAAGALGQGFNVLANEADRPRREAAARKQALLDQIVIADKISSIKDRQRGRPVAGEDEKGESGFFYESGERVPGVRPPKKETSARAPIFRSRTTAEGDEEQLRLDEKTGVFKPDEIERESPVPNILTGAPLKAPPIKTRVPFVSKAKPKKEEALSDFEAAFQRQHGRLPNADELADSKRGAEKESESDKRRGFMSTVQAVADRAVQRASKKSYADPEDKTNAALDELDALVKAEPKLREFAEEAADAIRKRTRRDRKKEVQQQPF